MSQKPKAGRSKKVAGKKEVAQTQSERFIEAARAAGVDESGKEFEKALGEIVPPKKPHTQKGSK
jgi:hypothetical protein